MPNKPVKRGSAAHRDYVKRMIAAEEEREHQLRFRARQLTLDIATITLGEMNFTEEQMRHFRDTFEKVEHEIAHLVVNESIEEIKNRDAICGIWVSKDRIDKAVHAAVGDELFCPFDERYSESNQEPYNGKDEIIMALKRAVEKRDDEIIQLKAQIKLAKVQKRGDPDGLRKV